MPNGQIQRAEDRIVTYENAAGQAKVTEIKVLLVLHPYIPVFE